MGSDYWTSKKSGAGNSSTVTLTSTTTIPASTSITVELFQDDGADGSGANTDAIGNAYDNSASVTLSGGTDETNDLSGFDADGSTDDWWMHVQLDGDGSDPTLDSPTVDKLSIDTGDGGGGGGPAILDRTQGDPMDRRTYSATWLIGMGLFVLHAMFERGGVMSAAAMVLIWTILFFRATYLSAAESAGRIILSNPIAGWVALFMAALSGLVLLFALLGAWGDDEAVDDPRVQP